MSVTYCECVCVCSLRYPACNVRTNYHIFLTRYPYCVLIIHIYTYIYRMSQEECARLRDGVPYVKVYRYNPKHLCPNLNGYGDNGQRILKL